MNRVDQRHAVLDAARAALQVPGASITYSPGVQVLPTAGVGINHLGPGFTRIGESQSWLIDRLDGKAVTSNCALMPFWP